MFENPRRGRQARNFTPNAPKILDLKSSSEQIVSRKLPLGAPAMALDLHVIKYINSLYFPLYHGGGNALYTHFGLGNLT